LRRKKRKIKAGSLLVTIINLAAILMITRYIHNGYFNIEEFGAEDSFILVYFILSTIFIKVYFDHKLRHMYLTCSLEDIDEMTGIEFEVYLYHKFKRLGYKARLTPVTADYGADLVLKKRRTKLVVQAKRYHQDVGIAAVQEVIGSIAYYNADAGMVVTNSFFTPNAMNLARANDITLWDRRALIKYLIREEEYDPSLQEVVSEKSHTSFCPVCGKKLVRRNGKYGYFLGCSGYPQCNYTEPVPEDEMDGL
jgi:restriction system protein